MRNKDNIYDQIRQARSENQKLLAILIDPDKVVWADLEDIINKINESPATPYFHWRKFFRQIELMN
jgi:putative glycerol-1-phosphate prenyltransferase